MRRVYLSYKSIFNHSSIFNAPFFILFIFVAFLSFPAKFASYKHPLTFSSWEKLISSEIEDFFWYRTCLEYTSMKCFQFLIVFILILFDHVRTQLPMYLSFSLFISQHVFILFYKLDTSFTTFSIIVFNLTQVRSIYDRVHSLSIQHNCILKI